MDYDCLPPSPSTDASNIVVQKAAENLLGSRTILSGSLKDLPDSPGTSNHWFENFLKPSTSVPQLCRGLKPTRLRSWKPFGLLVFNRLQAGFHVLRRGIDPPL
jgi:hypothetical protein